MKKNDGLLSVPETATHFGMDVRTVQEWIKSGRLDVVRGPSRRVMVTQASISALRSNAVPLAKKQSSLHGRFSQGARVPENFDLIQTYQELSEYTKAFAKGELTFLLLVGSPGSGKSSDVKTALRNRKHAYIDNHVSNQGLYCCVYEAQNAPIVLDDVNHFFRNPMACSLMKALTQTTNERVVSWETTAKTLEKMGVPKQFTTTSRICLIGNKWEGSDPDMAAVQDRATGVAFYPSAEAIHKQVRKVGWCDQDVWAFIGKHLAAIEQPSMREYYHGMQLKKAGMKWEAKLRNKWGVQ